MRGRFLSLLLLFAALARIAAADDVATTNIQFLNAARLRDPYYGYDTRGSLQTVTVEHFQSWKGGDVYAFVDLLEGDHRSADGSSSGDTTRYYGEVCARLNVSSLIGRPLHLGPVSNVFLATEIDDGRHYNAWLVGVGLDLRIPGLDNATVNLFRKDDSFNRPALQATAMWSRTVPVRSTAITFSGYVDVAKTDVDGLDIGAQPQLLADMAPLLRTPKGKLALGVEWYIHRNAHFSTAVPQILMKWTLR